MTNKIRMGLVVVTVGLVIGLVSIKKATKVNVTLLGMVHNSKNMSHIVEICDARNSEEANMACYNIQTEDSEVNHLCKLRLEINMEKFDSKCLRYYKLVERVRSSQDKVSDYLKKKKSEHVIYESRNPASKGLVDNTIKECENPYNRSDCLLRTHAFFIDGWYKKKKVHYLFEENSLAEFIKTHPRYEEDISICKDYQIEEKCKVMNEFMRLHSEATESLLSKSHSKNVIVIMGQEHMNYVSCKNFSKEKFNCQDIIL